MSDHLEPNQPEESGDDSQPSLDSESVELLNRYANGDDSAIGRLIDNHADKMKRYVANKIPRDLKRRFDASDIYQQMSIELFRIRERYQNQGSAAFSAMLRTMTDYLLQRAVEKERTQKRDPKRERNLQGYERSDLGDPLDALDAEVSSASVLLSRKERRAQLADAFLKLSEQDRELIIAVDYRGQTYAELAMKLDASAEALRKRHSRAVSRLREIMEQ